MEEYRKQLLEFLRVLTGLKESGLQVNREINAVVGALLDNFGIPTEKSDKK